MNRVRTSSIYCTIVLALFLLGCQAEQNRSGAGKYGFLGITTYTCQDPKHVQIELSEDVKKILIVNNGKEKIIQSLINGCTDRTCGKCEFTNYLDSSVSVSTAVLSFSRIEYSITYPFGSKVKINGTDYTTDTTPCKRITVDIEVDENGKMRIGQIDVYGSNQNEIESQFNEIFIKSVCKAK